MSEYHSYDLFVKNPLSNTNFPFLSLDCNNKKSVPPRMRFQEMHWHDDIQVTYVLEGELKIISLNHTLIIHQGEAVFINKSILHQFSEIDSTHYRSYIFPDIFIRFYDNSPMYKQVEEMKDIGICPIHHQEVIHIIQELDQAVYHKQMPNQEYYISMKLVEFMYAFFTYEVPQIQRQNIVGEYHLSLQKCLAFIHKHYSEDISLDDIAEYGNISAGYCGRLFLQVLEISPYEYLINYRIKKSLDELSLSDKTISQIALDVGFNDVSHYIQSFKKRMGTTPKQYQKQLFHQ